MKESPVNPNTVVTIVNKKNSNSNYGNYQVRMMQDKNGKPLVTVLTIQIQATIF
ncbi:hypothetical protein BSPWISOXPB_3429 [uncultured Gammaproteobacteria bacterium]|nr:hypothetical protein BSPWISOXPB_3429 [uncultured Gammaproteobacteria bacterium]